MTRTEALKSLVASLTAEIAALKAFDLDALAAATAAKEAGVGELADWGGEALTPEMRALAEEAAMLNETARVYVNLMAANVRTRLDALSGAREVAYRPRSAAA